jgi:hypothetical protein
VWRCVICALHQTVLCSLLKESLIEGHVAPVTMLKMNRQFSTNSCMETPLGSSTSGLTNLWYTCPKWSAKRFPWHAALTAVPIFLFLLSYQRLYIVNNIYIYIYIYIYIHTCLTA